MTKVTFFPVGRADTALIELSDGRRMLVDYANKRTGDDATSAATCRRCSRPT